uniref:Uncharacterized protein n=1 Tax=viral metagenome TaxID=1070528 RepID=A0A6H1ZNK3_9ZZZZ
MNKKNFTLMIKTFSEVYEKTLNPYVIETYFNLFQEIPDSQVAAITRSCLRKCKYFPRPADVFEQLSETPERYIPKPQHKFTPDEIEKNIAEAKKLKDIFNNKFNMSETVEGR